MQRVDDGKLSIFIAGPVGFGNNIYIVQDQATGEAAFIDAPGSADELIAVAEEAGVTPRQVLLTHGHFDHTPGIDGLKEKYGTKLVAADGEPGVKPGQLDQAVAHGDSFRVGELEFRAIHNPGHTPGSTTFVTGKHAFVGDTLFPGGPGRTGSNANLLQEIESITTRLYTLPDDTQVWPGHGDATTIGSSKVEYAGFAARDHSPDLHGDVLWATS
jgi:glyoxylase-like metal-dependent hydrolase (beta-lactamase superfamily II)